MRSNSQPRAVMSSGMCQVRVSWWAWGVCPSPGVFEVWWEPAVDGVLCQVRVEVGVGGGGGVPGVGEVRRHPSADLAAEGTDHMYVVIGVWVEEIPVAGVEIDAFDVDALGSGTL